MAAKNGGGRPSKLTAEVVGKIMTAIRSGATYEHSCMAAGISYQTFRNWIIRGKASKSGEYFDFLDALKRAEGEGVVLLVGNIKKSANNGQWQAAAWILERRYPELYGRQRLEIKVETWQDKAVADIREGNIPFKELAEAFDYDLATELFARAGVPVEIGQDK